MHTSKIYALSWDLHNRLMPAVRGRSVIDIGANDGGYTNIYLGHGARRVVSVEPGPRLAEIMRQRFKDDPRVVVRQVGLSDAPSRLVGVMHHHSWCLAQPGQFKDENRLHNLSPGAQAVEGSGVFDVDLTTLDEIVEEHQLTDLAFVKLDTDGYEPRVLRGARKTLSTLRPPFLLELSYMPQDFGDDIGAFLDDIYAQDYVLATMAGVVATRQQVWEQYPWHTSIDVIMLPVETARSFDLPALIY